MLKINTYTDFGQFVAALKAAEKLDLRYTVERKRTHFTHRPLVLKEPRPLFSLTPPEYIEGEEKSGSRIEYTLTILPDEAAEEAPPNPWLGTAGMFADDPTLLPMTEEIYHERDKQDAEHDEQVVKYPRSLAGGR